MDLIDPKTTIINCDYNTINPNRFYTDIYYTLENPTEDLKRRIVPQPNTAELKQNTLYLGRFLRKNPNRDIYVFEHDNFIPEISQDRVYNYRFKPSLKPSPLQQTYIPPDINISLKENEIILMNNTELPSGDYVYLTNTKFFGKFTEKINSGTTNNVIFRFEGDIEDYDLEKEKHNLYNPQDPEVIRLGLGYYEKVYKIEPEITTITFNSENLEEIKFSNLKFYTWLNSSITGTNFPDEQLYLGRFKTKTDNKLTFMKGKIDLKEGSPYQLQESSCPSHKQVTKVPDNIQENQLVITNTTNKYNFLEDKIYLKLDGTQLGKCDYVSKDETKTTFEFDNRGAYSTIEVDLGQYEIL